MNNEDTTYLYEVRPKRPIKNLTNVPVVRTHKSLHLTKDDVKKCLPLASVWRRFANEGRLERVVPSNVDRLHNDHFMTEEEYKEFLINQKGINHGKVAVDESPKEEIPDFKNEAVNPDKEESIKESTNDEATPVNDTTVEEVKEEPVDVKEDILDTDPSKDINVDASSDEIEEPVGEVAKETTENEKESESVSDTTTVENKDSDVNVEAPKYVVGPGRPAYNNKKVSYNKNSKKKH